MADPKLACFEANWREAGVDNFEAVAHGQVTSG